MGVTSSRLEKALAEYPGTHVCLPCLAGLIRLMSVEETLLSMSKALRQEMHYRCAALFAHGISGQYNCCTSLSPSTPEQSTAQCMPCRV